MEVRSPGPAAQEPPQLPPANNQPAVPQPAQNLPPPPPPNIPVVPHKRASVGAGLDDDGGVRIALHPLKRGTADLDISSDKMPDNPSQGGGKITNDIGYGDPGKQTLNVSDPVAARGFS